VRRLLALDKANLTGAIIGKALYEGVIHLDEAIAVVNGKR
jgi:phosphoribosylformimino-5-aminoimidazole carboxamide ribonucleotide (ProFAR) isomerase